MVKKGLLILILAAVAAGGAFALPEFKLSAGAGGYFTSDFGGGVEGTGFSFKIPYAGGGGFAFFDATYAELSFGFWGGGGTFKMEGVLGNSDVDMSYMGLDIGLLGKYPIDINEKLSVFPLLGITYRVMLSAKNEDGNGDAPGDLSALWFKLGGGVDFSFTDHVYFRGGLLYGLRLANKFEKDGVDTYSALDGDAKALLGHGLEIKLAVGYRF